MADDLETGVLGELERLGDGGNGVAAVRVARDILVQRLHADFEPGAAVAEHGAQVRLETVVWPGFDGDANALGVAHFAGTHRLVDAGGLVAAQRVVQLGDKVLAVRFRQRHERAAHDDVLDLVDAVAECLDLLDPAACLLVGVVPGPDGAHRRWFVAGVRLGGVFKVGVGPAGTVDADVAGEGDVRAAVRLAHDCHHGYAGGCSWAC